MFVLGGCGVFEGAGERLHIKTLVTKLSDARMLELQMVFSTFDVVVFVTLLLFNGVMLM